MAQNDSEWPISPDSQLFQSFPTNVAENDSEQPILGGQKKKNTMIQGNFYERLHFYMDSCAISPMASLLDYIQLLMIGQAIQAMKVAQNAKKLLPKWSENEMLIFRLRSTSDDQPSNPSDKSHPKCEKIATKSSKNEMLIFGLCSTSDDLLSNKSHPKCEKIGCQMKMN